MDAAKRAAAMAAARPDDSPRTRARKVYEATQRLVSADHAETTEQPPRTAAGMKTASGGAQEAIERESAVRGPPPPRSSPDLGSSPAGLGLGGSASSTNAAGVTRSPALSRDFSLGAAGAPTGAEDAAMNPMVTPMLTDFYQLTMAYAYWKANRHNDAAVFELFFRKNPFNGEFTIFAGLGEVLKFLRSYRITAKDLAYVRQHLPADVDEAFYDYLLGVDCGAVTVSAVAEGTVVFPRTPLMKVEGPLGVCQLLETTLLNLTNFPSLVCTNAARMRLAAGEDKMLIEFGLRRAQGPDGAMSASKYACMGGFDATSNVAAAMMHGIDVRGTHAHAFVSAFEGPESLATRRLGEVEDFWGRVLEVRARLKHSSSNLGELAAFVAYAQAFPANFLALVDTYDTLKSGVPNFVCVALALKEAGYNAIGIRLDSGDLAYLSLQSREIFMDASEESGVDLSHLQILASNDINESVLAALDDQGHTIDAFGVGTNLVTCQAQPALGMVYKLVEVNGRPTIKLSQDQTKVTIPGNKNVYRLIGAEGVAICDVMVGVHDAPPAPGKRLLCRHPFSERKRAYVTPSYVIELLRPVWVRGRAAPTPTLVEVRNHVKDQLQLIRADHKRMLNPTEYKVSVTVDLFNFMHELLLSVVAVTELS